MTPIEFAKDYIFVWEDGQSKDPNKTHSMDKKDPGNYETGKLGQGRLIGSNHGVTAPALAKFRKIPVSTVSVSDMHELKIEEAAAIALKLYYYEPHLDLLPWDATIASVMDFGWGTGPGQAVKTFQKMISAVPDGQLGPGTAAAYQGFRKVNSLEESAKRWGAARNSFYESLNQEKYGKYLKGWKNRTAYFMPGGAWWKKFNT